MTRRKETTCVVPLENKKIGRSNRSVSSCRHAITEASVPSLPAAKHAPIAIEKPRNDSSLSIEDRHV
jgi:hypothetical protein